MIPKVKIIRRYISPLAMIAIGIGLSALAFLVVHHREYREIELGFEQDATERYDSLKREIEFDLQTLEAITAFYKATKEVDRSEFRSFVKPLLGRHPSVQALEWIPRVSTDQREPYEERAKRDGFPGFHITERDTQGRMVRARERDEYFPVYFVEPYTGNETALGFDLASNPTREASLSLARVTGRTTATSRVTLVQETANQPGVLVFAPVYRKQALLASPEDRRKNLMGFVLGVFRISNIMEHALAHLSPKQISVSLYDQSAPEKDHFLHAYAPRTAETTPKSDGSHKQFKYTGAVTVADRSWAVVLTPTPGYLAAKRSWQPWAALTVGLLFTAFLAGYLFISINRARRIEGLVEERTRDLAQANTNLHTEITERKQAEEARKRSEEAALLLAQETGVIAEIGRIISSSLDIEEVYERFAEEVRKLIPFDRILVTLVNRHDGTLHTAYTVGMEVAGGRKGVVFPTAGSVTEEMVGTGAPALLHPESIEEVQNRFPALVHSFQADLCSRLSVPLIARGEVIGSLTLWSKQQKAYGERYPRLVQGVASQIAGAIANAQIFRERKRVEEALRESEIKYRRIFEALEDLYYETNYDGIIKILSPSVQQLTGWSAEDLIGKPVSTVYVNPDDRKELLAVLNQKGFVRDYELLLRRKNDSVVSVSLSAHVLLDENRQPIGVAGVLRDITERKRAEEQIRESLREKEVLLKEIHHRVKNNLQIVSSLLYLQTTRIEHPGAVSALRESRNRVRSMALIHERLYQSPNLASVDMGEYTRNLVSDLQHCHRTADSAVRLSLNVEDIPLGITEAIPCGLIINELVSNALKHAFPKEKKGEITIQLLRGNTNQITLTVSDNGIGFPEHVDFRKSSSLGLTLVNSLVDQLEGAIELDRGGGTAFTITFV